MLRGTLLLRRPRLLLLCTPFVLVMLAETVCAQPVEDASSPSSGVRAGEFAPDPARSPGLLGYVALSMEHAARFPVTDGEYALLDALVSAARDELGPRRPSYTKRQALRTLDALREIVDAACPERGVNVRDGSYSAALQARTCDCDILVVTYLTVAEAMDLPLYGVLAPNHLMLLWEEGDVRFLWETTTGTERSAASYERAMHIHPDAIRDGCYLRRLSRREMVGYLYANRAGDFYTRGDFRRAVEDYDRALSLNPDLVMAYSDRGLSYQALGDHARAIDDLTRAVAMDPNYADAYYARASSHVYLEQYGQGVSDFDRVLHLQGSVADAHYGRGLAYHALGQPEAALRDYTQALARDSTLVQAYYNRAQIEAGRGDLEPAIDDYLEFLRRVRGRADYQPYVPIVQQKLRALRGRLRRTTS